MTTLKAASSLETWFSSKINYSDMHGGKNNRKPTHYVTLWRHTCSVKHNKDSCYREHLIKLPDL